MVTRTSGSGEDPTRVQGLSRVLTRADTRRSIVTPAINRSQANRMARSSRSFLSVLSCRSFLGPGNPEMAESLGGNGSSRPCCGVRSMPSVTGQGYIRTYVGGTYTWIWPPLRRAAIRVSGGGGTGSSEKSTFPVSENAARWQGQSNRRSASLYSRRQP